MPEESEELLEELEEIEWKEGELEELILAEDPIEFPEQEIKLAEPEEDSKIQSEEEEIKSFIFFSHSI